MLSVVTSSIRLSVIMLNVVMLSVVAPVVYDVKNLCYLHSLHFSLLMHIYDSLYYSGSAAKLNFNYCFAEDLSETT